MRHQTVGAKGTQRLFKRNEKQHSNQAKTTTLLMPKPRQKGLEANPIETRPCRICRPPLRPSSTDHLNIGYVPKSLRDVKCLLVIHRLAAPQDTHRLVCFHQSQLNSARFNSRRSRTFAPIDHQPHHGTQPSRHS